MNLLITRKLLGRDAEAHEAPVILDSYANTSSAGSVIARTSTRMTCPAAPSGGSARSAPVTRSVA